MPLRLIPPRKGKSPNYTIRGTYLGVHVNDRSTGTSKRKIAQQVLQEIERDIERSRFSKPGEPTFGDAAAAYMRAGGERRFISKLLDELEFTPLREVDQAKIDEVADKLYPKGSPATKNRQVHTPISAVLKRAKIKDTIDRPIGSEGNKTTGWLWPEQTWALFEEAEKLDLEFCIFLETLLYAGGLRLSEGLDLLIDDLRLSESFCYLRDSKTGVPRPLHLPPHLVVRLANHPRGLERPGARIFRFHKSGAFYKMLRKAAKAAGIALPRRQAFHIMCHTYGTWMRRYGKLDALEMLDLKRWEDEKSVRRYMHTEVTAAQRKADLLPTPVKKAG